MARMPRLVVPGCPHHVTQRGARRMQTFFSPTDYRIYLSLLREHKDEVGVDVWAYCLMPNHVNLVVVPEEKDSLATLFRQVHRRYTRYINKREEWRGHLWQERFYSTAMDEHHLLAAVRYVELNPVRADLCESPTDWPWSSVHAHLTARDDSLVAVNPMLARVRDWQSYLLQRDDEAIATLRKNSSTGRPAGDLAFIAKLEEDSGFSLQTRKPGRQPAIK